MTDAPLFDSNSTNPTDSDANRLDWEDDNVLSVDDAGIGITAIDHDIDEVNRKRSCTGSEQNKLQRP